MRFACDTGGTFTDLIVEDAAGELHMFKASTTPDDPMREIRNLFPDPDLIAKYEAMLAKILAG